MATSEFDDFNMVDDCIRDRKPGIYQLPELLEDVWDIVSTEAWYARKFKKAVIEGRIPSIRWVGQTSNGRQLYELGKMFPNQRRSRFDLMCWETDTGGNPALARTSTRRTRRC